MTGVPPRPKRSLLSLLGDLPGYFMELVRSEIEQLKQELIRRATQAGVGIGLIVAALTILFLALGTFTAAAVLGLAEVLPAWAAALIVGGALLLLGGILTAIGVSQIKRGSQGPHDSIDSIKQDVRVIKGIEEED